MNLVNVQYCTHTGRGDVDERRCNFVCYYYGCCHSFVNALTGAAVTEQVPINTHFCCSTGRGDVDERWTRCCATKGPRVCV